jgi:protein TonB
MFNELPISGVSRRPTHTRWTFLVSLGGELAVLAVLLLIPLIYIQTLPRAWQETRLLPPPPPTAPAQTVRATTRTAPTPTEATMTIPAFIPPHAVVVHDTLPVSSPPGEGTVPIIGAIPGQENSSRWNSILPKSVPAPPSESASTPSRIKVSRGVEAARLIRMVKPNYPQIALQARIEGTVVLEAIVGTDGSVESLRYISGPPLLVQAAIEAVRQWRYQPTLLNGKPVSVETTITVIFKLNGSGGDWQQPPTARFMTIGDRG